MAADNSAKPNVRLRRIDWKALVAESTDLNAPHDAYEFSKKTFKETDNSGVYSED